MEDWENETLRETEINRFIHPNPFAHLSKKNTTELFVDICQATVQLGGLSGG